MKRTRLEVGSNLYNPDTDLERTELKLYEICYIIGLSPENLDSVTIDEIINGLRGSFYYTSPPGGASTIAAIDWLRQANFHLVLNARKYWWYRQLIRGVKSRGQ